MSTVQALNMLSVCRGVVERGVQMTSTMTQHVEHFEDFAKAHVESWLKILKYVHLLRTRKCLAALLVSEPIDEDKK